MSLSLALGYLQIVMQFNKEELLEKSIFPVSEAAKAITFYKAFAKDLTSN